MGKFRPDLDQTSVLGSFVRNVRKSTDIIIMTLLLTLNAFITTFNSLTYCFHF